MADGAGQGASEGSGSPASRTRPGHRRVAQWTRDYVRLPGIPDEYIAQDGTPREERTIEFPLTLDLRTPLLH